MEANNTSGNIPQNIAKETLWYLDNYILLKDYYDRTISRIAARCIRQGNIAMEDYPYYGYILDVLEEISETGEYIIAHQELYPYVEKKIPGGLTALKKNLSEFQTELNNNASPDMIKQDKEELEKMKEALGTIDKSRDPTAGAGMSMDEVIDKLMRGDAVSNAQQAGTPRPQSVQRQPQRPQQSSPNQPQRPQQSNLNQPRPQGQPQKAPQQPNRPQSQGGQPNQQTQRQAPQQQNQTSPFNKATE